MFGQGKEKVGENTFRADEEILDYSQHEPGALKYMMMN